MSGPPMPAGNLVLGIAIDIDAGKMWLRINGTWYGLGGTGNPETGAYPGWSDTDIIGKTIYPAMSMYVTDMTATLKLLASEQTGFIPSGYSAWLAPPTSVAIRTAVTQPYDITYLVIRTAVEQSYALTHDLRTAVDQIYGLRIGAPCVQWYGDAPVVRQGNDHYYRDCWLVRRQVAQLYEDTIGCIAGIIQPYDVLFVRRAAVDSVYAISAALCKTSIDQIYDLDTTNRARAANDQRYGLLGDPGQVLRYTAVTTAGGVVIDPSTITISAGLAEYCLSCTLQLARQADYLACVVGEELVVTVNGETYRFFVEGRGRSRDHGSTGYTVQGMSRTALLGAPYASPVAVELSGMASTIICSLAPGYTVQWDTLDWYIPAGILLPADKTVLDTIRDIAHAAGAIVQTEPDGTLVIQPDYIAAVPTWPTRPPDYFLTDAVDFFTDAANFEYRDGFNRFLVSDQLTSAISGRLEQEQITDATKIIRRYRTPWGNDLPLRHTGGEWVITEPLGVEITEKDEVIEFVAGSGHTQYPIYAVTAMAWLQTSLGLVRRGEDGTLEAEIPEESLLAITYQTRCWKWQVSSPRAEQVQFIADEVEI